MAGVSADTNDWGDPLWAGGGGGSMYGGGGMFGSGPSGINNGNGVGTGWANNSGGGGVPVKRDASGNLYFDYSGLGYTGNRPSGGGEFNLGGGHAGEGGYKKDANGNWYYDPGRTGAGPSGGTDFGLQNHWGESRYIDDGSGNMVPNPWYVGTDKKGNPTDPNWFDKLFDPKQGQPGEKAPLLAKLLGAAVGLPLGPGGALLGGVAAREIWDLIYGKKTYVPPSHDPYSTGPGDGSGLPPGDGGLGPGGGGSAGGGAVGGGGTVVPGVGAPTGPIVTPPGGPIGGGGPFDYGYGGDLGVRLTGQQINDGSGQGGGMPNNYATPNSPQDPFSAQNLFNPMLNTIDKQTAGQMAQINEQAGLHGTRFGGGLQRAKAMAEAQAANDKNTLVSQFLYRNANEDFQRQLASAQLGLQTGGAQDARDFQNWQMLNQQGGQDQNYANQGLGQDFNEWMRQNYGALDMMKGFVNPGGYQSDHLQSPSKTQEYGGYAALLASILASL